jgi:hypothetical protein
MSHRRAEDEQPLNELRHGFQQAAGNPSMLEDLPTKALGGLDHPWWKVMYLEGELELERERHAATAAGTNPATVSGPRLAARPGPPPADREPHRRRWSIARALRRAGRLRGAPS